MKINKIELQNALEIVKPGLASKEVVEQATSFAFLEGCVITYNDSISISAPVETGIEGAVKAEELYKLLSKMKTEESDLQGEGGELVIKAGRASAGIPLQQEIRLPLEETGKIESWYSLPDSFMEALKFAQYTCSTDLSRPVLTCVHVDAVAGVVESSDNYRLTRVETGGGGLDSFLFPAAAIPPLLQMKPVSISVGEGWVHFQAESGAVFSSRVFEGDYPDISPFLKVKNGMLITFPVILQEVLEKAAIFSTRESTVDNVVRVTLADRRMIIKGEGEYGWFKEELNYKYKGEPVTFTVNPVFLQQALKGLKKCVKGERVLLFEGEGWKHAVALFKE